MIPEPKLQRILFATDFLQSSRLALDYAVAFAQHFQATLIMVHVIELSEAAMEVETETRRPSLSRASAQQRLEALAAGVRRTGLRVETFVEDGIPSDAVLAAIATQNADLLVLGVHGVHRGLGHLLVGSNTEKILLDATCPTLTVGAHVLAGIDLHLDLREVVYFSDFTPEAAAAAPYAIFFGKEFNVPVDVCQLIPAPAEHNEKLRNDLAEQYCQTMQSALGESDSNWCRPAFHLHRAMAIDEIVARAQSQDAGLIVLGIRTQSQLGRHLHTSFAYRLLARAACPVLSVPPSAALSPGHST